MNDEAVTKTEAGPALEPAAEVAPEDRTPPETRGIPRANKGALKVLQGPAPDDPVVLHEAAQEVSRYHAPTGDQAERHERLSAAVAFFLTAIVANTPPGPERSTALSRAREAKMWASAAVALEGH